MYNTAEYKYFKSLGSVNEKVGKLSLLPDVHAYKKNWYGGGFEILFLLFTLTVYLLPV